MRKLWIILAAGLALALPAFATVPVGFVTVSGSNVKDSYGNLITNATISFAPVSVSGAPVSYRIGPTSYGQAVTSAITAQVTTGSFTLQLADAAITNPANICYNVTLIDNVSGNSLLGGGYGCVQPTAQTTGALATANSYWCNSSTSVCAFDDFIPNTPAGALVATGPPGPAGPAVLVTSSTNLAASVTGCSSSPCTIAITTAITVPSNLTVPSTTTLDFVQGGSLNPASGVTLTVDGAITAPATAQIFGGAGTISLGASITEVHGEWFGAVADWNGTSGTDDTSSLQSAIGALSAGSVKLGAGCYKTSSVLTITKSSVGISGVNQGYGVDTGIGAYSCIMQTSASADIVDIYGTSPTNRILWNHVTNVALQRSVLPTGTATGLSINHVAGANIDGVQSADSIRGFYLHDAPSAGFGAVRNSGATWGEVGLTGYSGGISLYGFYVDSADGTPENSLSLYNNTSASTISATAATTYGIYVYGSAINDFESDWFQGALLNYGIYVDCTGTLPSAATASACYDLHFVNSVVDSSYNVGIYVTGLSSYAFSSLQITGGWVALSSTTATAGIEVNTSAGVTITDVKIYVPYSFGIDLVASGNVKVEGNTILNTLIPVNVNGSVYTVVSNNIVNNEGVASTVVFNYYNGATNNILSGNSFVGTGITGMSFATATGNNYIGYNTIELDKLSGAGLSDLGQYNTYAVAATGFNHTFYTGSATLTFSSIAPGATQTQTMTIENVTAANFGVMCNPGSGLGMGLASASYFAIAPNTVSVSISNLGTTAFTPNAVVWSCSVFQ